MSYKDANALKTDGEKFAAKHPHLALLILKRFDTMLAMGIDKLKEFVDSSKPSYTSIE